MTIAIPVSQGKLSPHFGHCEYFALAEVNDDGHIVRQEQLEAPPHQPGVLPLWLAEHGVGTIIAGGMGSRAQSLFIQQGIEVVVGAPADTVDAILQAYIAGTLEAGANVCDH